MMLFLVALAHAQCDPAALLPGLIERGDKEAYLCVSRAESGKDLLLAEIDKDPLGEHNRVTRALVLWLLARSDQPMDPDLVARLSASDRRLLADGIRARRGRASPSVDHAKVFSLLHWYRPVPTYTDTRLKPIDRANLEVADPSVRLVPESGSAPEHEVDEASIPGSGPAEGLAAQLCGCDSAGGGAGFVAGAFAALLTVRRRR